MNQVNFSMENYLVWKLHMFHLEIVCWVKQWKLINIIFNAYPYLKKCQVSRV